MRTARRPMPAAPNGHELTQRGSGNSESATVTSESRMLPVALSRFQSSPIPCRFASTQPADRPLPRRALGRAETARPILPSTSESGRPSGRSFYCRGQWPADRCRPECRTLEALPRRRFALARPRRVRYLTPRPVRLRWKSFPDRPRARHRETSIALAGDRSEHVEIALDASGLCTRCHDATLERRAR
jgi:hypothetical protein